MQVCLTIIVAERQRFAFPFTCNRKYAMLTLTYFRPDFPFIWNYLMKLFFLHHAESCPYKSCYIGSTFMPKLQGNFLATENFFYTSRVHIYLVIMPVLINWHSVVLFMVVSCFWCAKRYFFVFWTVFWFAPKSFSFWSYGGWEKFLWRGLVKFEKQIPLPSRGGLASLLLLFSVYIGITSW